MTRLALAVVAGCVAATFAYALLRIAQRIAVPEADPALVLYSEHAAYFWRSWTAGYAGAMAAFSGWLLAARDPHRTARGLSVAIVLAALALAAQAALVP